MPPNQGEQVKYSLHHDHPVRSVALFESGEGIWCCLTGGDDLLLRVWDIEKNSIVSEMKGHTREISCLTIAEMKGRPVALSAGYEKDIYVWDLSTFQLMTKLVGNQSSIKSIVVTSTEEVTFVFSCSTTDNSTKIHTLMEGVGEEVEFALALDPMKGTTFTAVDVCGEKMIALLEHMATGRDPEAWCGASSVAIRPFAF